MIYINRNITSLQVILFISCFFVYIECGCNFGTNPSTKKDVIENCTSCQYIIPAYISTCCGSLQRVEIWSSNFGSIDFQVWKTTATNVYQLTHMYNYYVPEVDTIVNVYFGDDILIEENDVIGWYASGDAIIPYSVTTEDRNIQLPGVPGFSVGSAYTLNTPYLTDRNYGIRVFVHDSKDPYFTNLPQTVTVYDTAAVGTYLYTVSYSDDNAGDIPHLTIQKTGSSDFVLNTATGEITVGSSLTFGTHTVTVQVTDACGRSGQEDLSVTVLNMPPEILNLPSSVDVIESTEHETLLYNLTLRDQSGNDTVTCSLNSTSPTGAPFLVKYISGTSNFGVYSLDSPNFDYDNISSFQIVVDCTDSKDTVSESLFVYLIKNSEPTVHNLPGVITIPSSTAVGTIVFAVNSTDPEGDQLGYYLNYCTACPFTISQSGHIFLKTSIKDTAKFSYNLYIVVSDKYGTVTDKLLTILVTGVNSVPVVSNLDQTINVPETAAVGTVIFTTFVSDADGDPLSYQYEYDPVETMWKISMDESTGRISIIESLDYETGVTSYKFSFTVNDGKVSAPKATLTVNVQSRNEPPEFAHHVYHVSREEGQSGRTFPDPGFVVNDPDTGDSWTYKITSGDDHGRFHIDGNSGILQFKTDYVVDHPDLMPPFVTLVIAAVDSQGASGTTTLSVTISDSNNKTPYFPNNQYHVTVTYDVAVLTSVAYITALDDDYGPTYNQISYSIQPTLNHQYFDINGNALLTTARSLREFENSTKLYTLINALDKGNRMSSVTVTVHVVQGISNSFFDDADTVAWFAALMSVLAVLLGATVVGLYRYCKYGYVFSKKGLFQSCKGKRIHSDKGDNYQRSDMNRKDSRVSIVEWSEDTDGSNMWMPPKYDSWNQRHKRKLQNTAIPRQMHADCHQP